MLARLGVQVGVVAYARTNSTAPADRRSAASRGVKASGSVDVAGSEKALARQPSAISRATEGRRS